MILAGICFLGYCYNVFLAAFLCVCERERCSTPRLWRGLSFSDWTKLSSVLFWIESYAHCLQFWSIFLCSSMQSDWDLLPYTPQFLSFTRFETETLFHLLLCTNSPEVFRLCFRTALWWYAGWGKSMKTPLTVQQVLGQSLVLSFMALGELTVSPRVTL